MHPDPALMTIVASIALGVSLFILAHRMNIPAIGPLLVAGIVCGPMGFGWVTPDSLGEGLGVIVSLGVSLILFEGGLSLDVKGYQSASGVIRRLLSVGVLITWLSTSALSIALFGFDWKFAILVGSLVIVTGPTVVSPLLKRIDVNERLRSILHWESVLVDPIGVFIVLLSYELLFDLLFGEALTKLALRGLIGTTIGLLGGLLMYRLLLSRWIPDGMTNIFSLAGAFSIFAVADLAISEAGLLAVTVAGLSLGARLPPEFDRMRQFKGELTELFIGMLFILLSARLDIAQFSTFGMNGVWLLVAVILVIRPLNICVSTWRSKLSIRERLFLAWVAPRGIVAASMASLFSMQLVERGVSQARFIETFTFLVIFVTVLLQSFTADAVARLLKVKQSIPSGWIIVGAHSFGQKIARHIETVLKQRVVLLDLNLQAVMEARDQGLCALAVDARDTDALAQHANVDGMSYLLALTDNEDLNMVVCHRWARLLGRSRVFRWGHPGFTARPGLEPVGSLIWTDLERPTQISEMLVEGSAHLTVSVARAGFVPLLAWEQNRVNFQPSGKALCLVQGTSTGAG